MKIEEKFEKVYRPLMNQFIDDLKTRPYTDYTGIPHPFLPIWGRNYERAFKKIAIVGKETRWWGMTLEEFIPRYLEKNYEFSCDRTEFRNFKFLSWAGKSPFSFWAFWMKVIAKVYGVENWLELKYGKKNYLLDDFVWGNTHSIETNSSKAIQDVLNRQIAPGYWYAFNEAERILNRIDYLEMVFNPDVVILTDSEYHNYLGSGFEEIEKPVEDKVSVLKRGNLLVFQCCHPTKMGFIKEQCEPFARIIRDLLNKYNLFFPLTNILKDGLNDKERKNLVERMRLENDKYKAVEVIAMTLRKTSGCMSVQLLANLLNEAGYTTNRNTPFTGNKHGPYKFISAVYNRAKNERPDVADAIASSFTKPNGAYAY